MNNESLITEIKQRIIKGFSPKKIILFGSYAYGNPDRDSDVDMLVICDKELPDKGRAVIAENLMKGIMIPTDFMVYTSKEIEKFKSIKNHFVSHVLDKGKIIYER